MPVHAAQYEMPPDGLATPSAFAGRLPVRSLEKILRFPEFIMNLGEAIMQNSTSADSLERAEHEFRAALAENPRNAGAEAKLGKITLSRGSVVRAEQEYRHTLTLQADQTDPLKRMAEICSSVIRTHGNPSSMALI
jgi:thioredoxin-like negative regulator of GroEL